MREYHRGGNQDGISRADGGCRRFIPTNGCGDARGNSRSQYRTEHGGAAPASAAPKGIYPPNTLVSVKNWDMALNRVEHPGKTLTWSQYNNVSNAAGEWVVVIFDMKNTGNTNFGVNQGDFQLLADGGITYRPSTDGGAIIYSSFKGGQNIGSQTPPGVSVTYYIPFDVAPGATGLTFQFNQDTKPKFTLP